MIRGKRNFDIRFLLAFFFLFLFVSASYQSFSEVRKSEIKKESTSKKQKKEKETPTVQVLSLEVVIPVVKAELPALNFSDVLKPVVSLTETIEYDVIEPYTSRWFLKTLFTCIISVNAP